MKDLWDWIEARARDIGLGLAIGFAAGAAIYVFAVLLGVGVFLIVVLGALLGGGVALFFYQRKPTDDDQQQKPTDDDRSSLGTRPLYILTRIIAVGLFFIFVFALQSVTLAAVASFVSVGVMTAGASLLVGAFLGFLFGVPRTLQREIPESELKGTKYGQNTNLEQISDWLSKIIVGIGLTQAKSIYLFLQGIAKQVAAGLGGGDSSIAFAETLLIFFLVCGFFYGFLWTRLYLAGLFKKSDQALQEKLQSQLKAMKEQPKKDEEAIHLVHRWLYPDSDAAGDVRGIREEKLKAVIKDASVATKGEVFARASSFRRRKWSKDKKAMERTIPIFEALVESDSEERFHRSRSQLGYALKDKSPPVKWEKAKEMLDKAIEIRNKQGDKRSWLYYEFNLAICNINLDPEYQQGQESKADARKIILEDIQTAVSTEKLKGKVQHNEFIKKWLKINKITDLL